jgi:hypothetical protein
MTPAPAAQRLTPGQIILRHQLSLPVNVTAIARDLGLNVWEMHNLREGIAGKIFKDRLNGGPTGYSIGVNASEGYLRKRFTVAHEIAHYILHRARIGDELTDNAMYRGGLSNWEEAEANKLAADILMPRKWISHFRSMGKTDPHDLAQEFQVSEPAMKVRLSYA